jgi:beta-glucosidase
MKRIKILLCFFLLSNARTLTAQIDTSYLNTNLSFHQRTAILLKQFTADEKIAFLQYTQPSVKRFHIPAYNWWNEALHGVARNGIATVFPQAIGMAATWDTELINQMGDVVSTEARAKYNYALQKNDSNGIYQGLTFWSPNINIFRDPRWGRGQETYGEDPYLTSRIGVAYVKGLQGNDPKYLKVAATAKHFAVHSGPESLRHSFDAKINDKDLYETYLPAFEVLVKDAKVEGVMCAYNRFDGVPCCSNARLLREILRDKWHFAGHVVTDCWAMSDMVASHKTYSNPTLAAIASLQAGSDLSCGPEMGALKNALQKDSGLIKNIDSALFRLLLTRFKLGMFDPPGNVPYSAILINQNNTNDHLLLAKKVAMESMVLLKNVNQLLPLKKNIKSIAVIGPYADNADVLTGNYNGTPATPITFLQGIQEMAGKNIAVHYAEGTPVPGSGKLTPAQKKDSLARALSLARHADVIIIVAGISALLEGEEGDANLLLDGFFKGDRTKLELPKEEQELIKAIYGVNKKIVLVLTSGSALAINWEDQHLPAILQAWYPGEEAGHALAEIIFGNYNPAGRLPVTFYKSLSDIPSFEDYNMKGRTYRYFEKKPLYPFGYGLSYSSFTYENFTANKHVIHSNDSLTVSLSVKNNGRYDGDEVVQLYVKKIGVGNVGFPIKSLQGFNRVFIKKNETRSVSFLIKAEQLRYYDEGAKDYKIAKGSYELLAGASSADIRQSIQIKVE